MCNRIFYIIYNLKPEFWRQSQRIYVLIETAARRFRNTNIQVCGEVKFRERKRRNVTVSTIENKFNDKTFYQLHSVINLLLVLQSSCECFSYRTLFGKRQEKSLYVMNIYCKAAFANKMNMKNLDKMIFNKQNQSHTQVVID